MEDRYPLDLLGHQIKAHWRRYRPKMYREEVKQRHAVLAYRARNRAEGERLGSARCPRAVNQLVPSGG